MSALTRITEERDALKAKLESSEIQFGCCSVCGFVAWREKDRRTEECMFCKLKAKLEASERVAAEMRWTLQENLKCHVGDYGCPACKTRIEGLLKSTDAGKGCVAREEVERLKDALRHIARYPVHSEPMGGAMDMQDIAAQALSAQKEDVK